MDFSFQQTHSTQAPAHLLVHLKYCEELWAQCMETERQRSLVTVALVVASTVSTAGLCISKDIVASNLAAMLLIALGIFSALMNYKLYERWRFTRNRLHGFYELLDSLYDAQILKISKAADASYYSPARNIGTQLFRYFISLTAAAIGCTFLILRN